MDAGSTFLLTQKDSHLWIVLSDPAIDAENVLIVNLTTAHHLKESVCLLEAGEHPWVCHRTCVNYADAKVVPLKSLYALKDKGLLRLQNPLSAALLQRVREGAAPSVRMSLENAQILIDQRLIDC